MYGSLVKIVPILFLMYCFLEFFRHVLHAFVEWSV